jgi:hypothetical protein
MAFSPDPKPVLRRIRRLARLCVNGKQVLTENIADPAGLLVAHDPYVLSLKGKIDTVMG